jgi:hypothetical protein
MTPKIKDPADAVKGIVEAVPVYQDALQPAVREIGRGLQTVAKTIHIALAPVAAIGLGLRTNQRVCVYSRGGKAERSAVRANSSASAACGRSGA